MGKKTFIYRISVPNNGKPARWNWTFEFPPFIQCQCTHTQPTGPHPQPGCGIWNVITVFRSQVAKRPSKTCVCGCPLSASVGRKHGMCAVRLQHCNAQHTQQQLQEEQVPWKLIVLTAHSVLGSFQGCLNSIPSMPNHAHSQKVLNSGELWGTRNQHAGDALPINSSSECCPVCSWQVVCVFRSSIKLMFNVKNVQNTKNINKHSTNQWNHQPNDAASLNFQL